MNDKMADAWQAGESYEQFMARWAMSARLRSKPVTCNR